MDEQPSTFAALIAAAFRHAITLGAGVLITNGVISDSQGPELIGIAVAFASFGWSWLQKHNTSKTIKTLSQGLQR